MVGPESRYDSSQLCTWGDMTINKQDVDQTTMAVIGQMF
jgi:hypothetical protein